MGETVTEKHQLGNLFYRGSATIVFIRSYTLFKFISTTNIDQLDTFNPIMFYVGRRDSANSLNGSLTNTPKFYHTDG